MSLLVAEICFPIFQKARILVQERSGGHPATLDHVEGDSLAVDDDIELLLPTFPSSQRRNAASGAEVRGTDLLPDSVDVELRSRVGAHPSDFENCHAQVISLHVLVLASCWLRTKTNKSFAYYSAGI